MFSSSLCGRALVRPGRVGEYLRLVGRSKPRPYVIFSGERRAVRFSYLHIRIRLGDFHEVVDGDFYLYRHEHFLAALRVVAAKGRLSEY